MEIMDDMTGLKKISETSHSEIITRIRQTRDTLLSNWQQGKRVESIAVGPFCFLSYCNVLFS